MLGVFLKTFRREEAFFNTVAAINQHISVPFRLYVVDDGSVSEQKAQLYERLQQSGHVIIKSDTPVSASAARVLMTRNLRDEAYVLRMDDDFELVPGYAIQRYMNLLNANPEFGVLSGLERQRGDGKGIRDGEISYSQGYFKFENQLLIKEHVDVKKLSYGDFEGSRYCPLDFGRNLLLIKRSVLETVCWDPRVAFWAEHEDFFLQLKASKTWKYVFVPEVTHIHRQDLSDLSDQAYRTTKNSTQNRSESLKNFLEKWNVTGIRNRYTAKQKLKQYRTFVAMKWKRIFNS